MKIESITVKNFKGCPDGTYNLSKLNMLSVNHNRFGFI